MVQISILSSLAQLYIISSYNDEMSINKQTEQSISQIILENLKP